MKSDYNVEEISDDNVSSCGTELKKKRFPWWAILLMALGCAAIVLIVMMIIPEKNTPEESEQPTEEMSPEVVAMKQNALKAVLQGFDGALFPIPTTIPGDTAPVTVYVAMTEDATLFGAAVETYTDKALNGTYTLMVGFDVAGNILGTEVMLEAEASGSGDMFNKDWRDFTGQFVGMNPVASDFELKVKQDGGEVDTITSNPISYSAYCDAVNRAAKAYHGVKEIALPKLLPKLKIPE